MDRKSTGLIRSMLALGAVALVSGIMPEWPATAQEAAKELVRGGFAGRSGEARAKLLQEEGGNQRSEAAVAAGLDWIVRHQAMDGHWGLHDFHKHGKCNCTGLGGNHDVAATAFALLPLLGMGTGKEQLHSIPIDSGVQWLVGKQAADGRIGRNGYEQALATIALCEAYGLNSDPALKGPAQRAINACVAWQHDAGGFRYTPRTAGDLSVTSWFIQAIFAGRQAGLQIPNGTVARCFNFLDSVRTADGSGYGYTGPNPAPNMTAAGMLAHEELGARRESLDKGIGYLQKLPPGTIKNYYFYLHATQVIRHYGGEPWDQWNPKMRDLLIENQDQGLDARHPDQKGSWTAEGDAWGGQFGRLGTTSLALLTLEVYYRHVPLYPREKK